MKKLGLLALCLVPTALSLAIPSIRKPIGKAQATNALASVIKKSNIDCFACTTFLRSSSNVDTAAIKLLISVDAGEDAIKEFIKQTCVIVGLANPYVCNGIVDMYGNEIYFVLLRVSFTPDELCGIAIDDCATAMSPLTVTWNLPIPDGKPAIKPWPSVNEPVKTQRVLHLSDIHIDRDYAEGSEADCEDANTMLALCCRIYPTTWGERVKTAIQHFMGKIVNFLTGKKTASPIKVPAGKWGSVANCDLPYRTFETAIRHISQTHKDLDYIMITGDMISHDMWDYNGDKTETSITYIMQVLTSNFPNTPIYQAVGNHEGVPSDSFAPRNMDDYYTRGPQWLYNFLAYKWSRWLSLASMKSVKYRASYAERPSPGLKLISLNSIYCSVLNFYIYINQTDPDDTLAWLVSELLDSEAKGEKVHIISHISPGDDYCLKGWTHNFYEIVNRFENTISAQFYGHTHFDHFQVYYENSNPAGRPTHFNFITPSLTTQSFNNPAYRIYTIDGGYQGASYTVLDAETYATDLDEANRNDHEPTWFLEYSARHAYNLPDLSPASWSALIDRLAVDEYLFRKFHRFYYRSSYGDNCVNEPVCRQQIVCSLRAAKSFEEGNFCAGLSAL